MLGLTFLIILLPVILYLAQDTEKGNANNGFQKISRKKNGEMLHVFACNPCARGHANLLGIIPVLVCMPKLRMHTHTILYNMQLICQHLMSVSNWHATLSCYTFHSETLKVKFSVILPCVCVFVYAHACVCVLETDGFKRLGCAATGWPLHRLVYMLISYPPTIINT